MAEFNMLDHLSRAKVAFDGRDYEAAAKHLEIAADYCNRMAYLQADMALMAAELEEKTK